MQIHLFSTPGEHGIEYIVEAARPILAGNPNPTVAYLPAAGTEQNLARQTRMAFGKLANVKTIDVIKQPLVRILSTLDRADLLYIPGGNTYLLAQRLHAVRVPLVHREAGAADLVAEIRLRVLSGLPLVCFSAGSVLCGPDILSSNDINECECTNFDGLDLLPFNINVHLPGEPGERRQQHEDRLQEFLASHPDSKVWALEDGAYLKVADDAIRVMGGAIWEFTHDQRATLVRPAVPERLAVSEQPAAPEELAEPEQPAASDQQSTTDRLVAQIQTTESGQPVAVDSPAMPGQPATPSIPDQTERKISESEGVQADPTSVVKPVATAKGDVHMKTLLILRHAKSSWKDEALPDHDRPLNKRGKEDAPRMGKLLRDQDLVPDLIISSDSRRTRETAKLVIEESHFEGRITYSRDLYAAEPEAYIEALAQQGGEAARVMIIGHNPGLEELLQELTGEYMPLTTAALAQVSLPIGSWSELANDEGNPPQGKLVNLWRPKDI